jgi:hypothetical protein
MPRFNPWTRPLSIAATFGEVIAQSVILPGSDLRRAGAGATDDVISTTAGGIPTPADRTDRE